MIYLCRLVNIIEPVYAYPKQIVNGFMVNSCTFIHTQQNIERCISAAEKKDKKEDEIMETK